MTFGSHDGLNFWDRILCTVLQRIHSYHNPLLLSLENLTLWHPHFYVFVT